MAALKRRELERRLAALGFVLLPGRNSSHRHYAGHGVKLTVTGHGPADASPNVVAGIRRQLRAVGLDL